MTPVVYNQEHDNLMCLSRVGIPMGTNCASLHTELCLYSYKADFKQGRLSKNEAKGSFISSSIIKMMCCWTIAADECEVDNWKGKVIQLSSTVVFNFPLLSL